MSEFKKGDRVSLMATVEEAGAYSLLVTVAVDGFHDKGAVLPERLTLVERPVREVTVTLTEEQRDYLYDLANSDNGDYVRGTCTALYGLDS